MSRFDPGILAGHPIDLIGLVLYLAITLGYHAFFTREIRVHPQHLLQGRMEWYRHRWIRLVYERQDGLLAVQTIRNQLMSSSFLASTAILVDLGLLTLLGLPASQQLVVDEGEFLDQLLSDPAYGERWARHWLDVARWAESNGHQHNRMRPHAWRYRDWVVRAFCDDKPFDQFVLEQIAGDELDPIDDESLIATGFLAAARYSGNELDKQIQRNDILVDITNTTAQAFLGLTLQCAQCHSHRFDPISIRDYYRFQAFFGQGQPGNLVLK